MNTPNDILITDEHFDVLLRHALLEQKESFIASTNETMALHNFAYINVQPISKEKGNALVEKLTNDFKSGGFKFRLNIFLLGFLSLATIAIVFFFTTHQNQATAQSTFVPLTENENKLLEPLPSIEAQALNSNPLPRMNPLMVAILDSSNLEDYNTTASNTNSNFPGSFTTMHIPEEKSLHYEDIPNLTEIEKKQTAKDKLKIMKEVGKKRIYTNLPAGATNVNGVLTQVGAFGIKDAEVTNFEYRTFLNDLLVQGKFDDYLLAKPVAGGWKALGIPEFENVYFENAKYNEFPVANMTRKGAELFCEWMTSSLKDAVTKKEIKWSGTSMPDFRLPSNVEWIYAARARDTTIQTPWEKYAGKNTLQNSRGCYLCNFSYTASKDKVGMEGPQMNKNNNKGCLAAKMSTRAIVTTAGRSIDTLVAAPVYSYNPNDAGVYCTLGNVAEMVWTADPANPTAKGDARSMGGSWYSSFENTKIEAPEQYVGVTEARAYIGFRIVMTYK